MRTAFIGALSKIQPLHIDALYNLANHCLDHGNPNEAIELYQEALKVQNRRGDILNNLGRAFLEKAQSADAVECFNKALAADPRCGEAAFNLGKAYTQQEKIDEADRAFETATRLRPNKPIWRLHGLGLCPTIFQSAAELDDYRTELERRLDEAPPVSHLSPPGRGAAVFLPPPLPFGERGPGVRGRPSRHAPPPSLPVLHMDLADLASDGFVPSFNLAHQGRSNRRLLEKFAALFSPHIPRRNPRGSQGKRRVGFVVTAPHVNSFLRTQAGIVERLDPQRFDTVVCCTDSGLAGLRQGIRRADVMWVPFAPRFNEAADTIAATSCDVLYFHKVSTDPLGYLLPFARLAPVQCTSWTTHYSSGVPEVDYYLSSALVEAADADREYTEHLVRLDAFPGFERRPVPIAPSSRADFGLPAQGSLYLCPQRLAKFHPEQDELFRQVLDTDSTGIMVMLAGNSPTALAQLLARFRKTLGTAADRIIVVPPQSPLGVRRLMSACDALLDIQHYSVSLMAKDAFAVGLPIVTLPGKFKVERYTLGFYRKFGIPDLIAGSPEEYVRLAVRLGKDAYFRRDLQTRIRAVSDVLYEDPRSVSEFERFAEEAIAECSLKGRT